MTKRDQILQAIRLHIEGRPGIEPANYGSWRDYRNESASVTRDLHDARELLRAVTWRESIGEKELREAFRAFSGRLKLIERDDDAIGVDYCTGQYYPTEYRKAACAVLASALWDYTRDHAMPKPVTMHNSESGETVERYQGLRCGDWLRRYFAREFGRRIGQRYFN